MNSYTFQVGTIACTALLDGAWVMGRERFLKRYPDATEAEYEAAFAAIGSSLDEAATSLNILCARVADEVLLVDAGEGGKPNGGLLPAHLAAIGVQPRDITLVILTHCHGDHVKGLLRDDQQPTFPNARYVMSQTEFTFWTSRFATQPEMATIAAMLQRQGLQLIEMDAAILPAVAAIPLAGHTPGQIGVRLTSGTEQLWHLADMLHSPIQFAQPQWSPNFDADPQLSVPMRRQMLADAAAANVLTMFYHLPFPGIGHVQQQGSAFIWRAIGE